VAPDDDEEISLSFQLELQSLQVTPGPRTGRLQNVAIPEGVRGVLRALARGVMAARAQRWDEVAWAIGEAEKGETALVEYLDATAFEAFSVALQSLKAQLAAHR